MKEPYLIEKLEPETQQWEIVTQASTAIEAFTKLNNLRSKISGRCRIRRVLENVETVAELAGGNVIMPVERK